MKKTYILSAVCSVIWLAGCSTNSNLTRAERLEPDYKYMTKVENQATKINAKLIWVHPPLKREKIRSARDAYTLRTK